MESLQRLILCIELLFVLHCTQHSMDRYRRVYYLNDALFIFNADNEKGIFPEGLHTHSQLIFT